MEFEYMGKDFKPKERYVQKVKGCPERLDYDTVHTIMNNINASIPPEHRKNVILGADAEDSTLISWEYIPQEDK